MSTSQGNIKSYKDTILLKKKNKKQPHMKGDVNFDQLVSGLQVLMKSTMKWINTLKAL